MLLGLGALSKLLMSLGGQHYANIYLKSGILVISDSGSHKDRLKLGCFWCCRRLRQLNGVVDYDMRSRDTVIASTETSASRLSSGRSDATTGTTIRRRHA